MDAMTIKPVDMERREPKRMIEVEERVLYAVIEAVVEAEFLWDEAIVEEARAQCVARRVIDHLGMIVPHMPLIVAAPEDA